MSKAIKHGQQNGFLIRVSVAECEWQSSLLFKRNVLLDGGVGLGGVVGSSCNAFCQCQVQ